MNISTRGRYAVMAMTELACRACGDGRPVTLSDIASRQQLSLCYLEQLFGGLRRAGLVTSARGPGGGYRLTRPAAKITIADILKAVHEPLHATRCTTEMSGCLEAANGEGGSRCATHDLWAELGQQILLFLGAITLEDVVVGRICGRAVALERLVTTA